MNYDTKTFALLVYLIDKVENNKEQDEFTFLQDGLRIRLRRVCGKLGIGFEHEISGNVYEAWEQDA